MFTDNTTKLVVIKYGGNAMRDDALTEKILQNIVELHQDNFKIVLVHGGGPFIKTNLEQAGIASEFIGGHRKTTPEAMKYIEMSLKGEVNGKLVRLLNKLGAKAVGLSGKDGKMMRASQRYFNDRDGNSIDLGQVGDVVEADTTLLNILLHKGYLPVITSIAWSPEGTDFNVNADMFAGFLAGKMQAAKFILLTDVDGLRRDANNPETLISQLTIAEMEALTGNIIQGGMIPKTDACKMALELGAGLAIITNGTKPEFVQEAITNSRFEKATRIYQS